MTNFIKILPAIFFLLVTAHTSYAGDSLSKKFPQVVLVQIRTEQNRVAAMEKDKRYTELEEVYADIAGVKKAMIRDFKAHFTFCPVYYFIDTNADRIKNRQFDGLLLNADGTAVQHPLINSSSTNYLVAYYGYPTAPAKGKDGAADREADSGAPMGKGLVVENYKFEQVMYFHKFGYEEALMEKKTDKEYSYSSKHYQIDYSPIADRFDKRLRKD